MSRGRIFFQGSPDPTIGVEVELFILNKDTLDLHPGAQTIIQEFDGDIHVKEELLESIVEVNTGICDNISEVREDLRGRIKKVIEIANNHDWKILSMGMHPRAKWMDQKVTDKDRYLQLVEKIQWPARRLLITGVHVHIGVESGEKAIAITNGLTRYIPHMIGMSANTPFEYGALTGLASTRTKLFEAMPTTGLPPELLNYSTFQKYMRTLIKAKSINSIREVWWDIRPHPGFGTVEIRTYDCVSTLDEIVNLAAYTQALVVGLSNHYDNGTQLPLMDRWIIKDNKWRATRYGIDADYIVDASGNQQSLKSAVLESIDKLIPIASGLGSEQELQTLGDMVDKNSISYQRQIRLYEKYNDLNMIIQDSIDQLEGSL
ncbi:MAG: YbdK family carboxylate-amine ligase [Candidatus Marinimicrobia bacterium]|jgi:carboxylate-amine ligase|nr:YbdK family carboxylate-amine ligase [Candidatus Neomarinimicrobiota bacterium]MBT3633304.1 YbdK family carboxylate-amine ligase [Candidatus Neomarinimicrobiota bacterium]MBT3681447.1 YbdK family carboxylate-amine ligase [Candidatus Neomarinimicrobiota bacterium]MBT3758586.1 YbdK family carboxylate-amine ligase [Candidatus Neomarinimicrobiota bacterium]MBT3894760.1 YbdK family carboxylate-amine ligase [Candidatus Neomarinimicrobiota bacterium]